MTLFDRLLAKVSAFDRAYVGKQGDIAIRIEQLREKRQMSKADLAEAVGVKPSQISRLLSGVANPTLKTIVRLEQALGAEVITVAGEPEHAPLRDMVRPHFQDVERTSSHLVPAYTALAHEQMRVFVIQPDKPHRLKETTADRIAPHWLSYQCEPTKAPSFLSEWLHSPDAHKGKSVKSNEATDILVGHH